MEGWLPDYWITLYLMSARRPRGLAARTLLRDAINLVTLRRWALDQGIELEKAVLSGTFLDAHEICSYADYALRALPSRAKIVPIAVSRALYWSRLTSAEQYVDWLAAHSTRRLSSDDVTYVELEAARKGMARAFKTLRGTVRTREHAPKQGLSSEILDRLIQVIQPSHPENPWTDASARIRNRALVLTQLVLGLRAGELLALKVDDVDTGKRRLRVVRRPDDAEDPRANQPTAKTRGRLLPLTDALVEILSQYITEVRFRTPGAKRHAFVWVGHKPGRNLGQPIEYTSLQQVYHKLRQTEGLGDDLRSHALRHTCNERLSELFDAADTTDNREAQIRNYLFGWSPSSHMASVYSQRHVRAKAESVSLDSQSRLLETLNGSEDEK